MRIRACAFRRQVATRMWLLWGRSAVSGGATLEGRCRVTSYLFYLGSSRKKHAGLTFPYGTLTAPRGMR